MTLIDAAPVCGFLRVEGKQAVSFFGDVVLMIPGAGGASPALMGSLYEPVAANTNLGTSVTYFHPGCLPFASTLDFFQVYVSALGTGAFRIKVAEPIKGGGWTVTSHSYTATATGVQSFATNISVPAKAIIGIHTPAGGATVALGNTGAYAGRMGYIVATGEVAAGVNKTFINSNNYAAEIQMRVGLRYTGRPACAPYVIDEDFTWAGAPALGVNNTGTAWTFPGLYSVCAGIGLANKYCFYRTTNIDRHTWRVKFQFQAAGDHFAAFKQPVLNDASAGSGTIVSLDLDTNSLIFYQTWSGIGNDTLPSVRSTTALVGLTVATGVDYWIEMVKVGKLNRARVVRDSDSVASDWVEVDCDDSDLAGYMYGRPGYYNIAGSTRVYAAQMYVAQPDAIVASFGDSITADTGGADQAFLYAQQINDRAGGLGVYSGDGGTNTLNSIRRFRHEACIVNPRTAFVLCGANDGGSDAARDAFIGYMRDFNQAIRNRNITPALGLPLPALDAALAARLAVMRNAMLIEPTFGKLWHPNVGISLNNDGSTYDVSKMADGVHPNNTGMTSVADEAETDFPEAFVA